jgi:hypothetical protein
MFLYFFNNFYCKFTMFNYINKNIFITQTQFLLSYFKLNELLWQEGLLLDFLQKKIVDNWMRKFLIFSSFLFNEKLIFDSIIKFFLNLVIWPGHKFFIFEFFNISNLFFFIFLFFILFFFIFFYFFLFLLMF